MKENTLMKVVPMSIVFLSNFGFFLAMTGISQKEFSQKEFL